MKKTALTVIILCMLICPVCFADQKENIQRAVAVVLDTSPTGYWSDIQKAARSVYLCSPDNSQILLYEVRGGSCRLKFSGIKRQPYAGLHDFNRMVHSVSADWFISSHIIEALQEDIYERLLDFPGTEGQATLVIVSDGSLSRKQSRTVNEFALKVQNRHNWHTVITGAPEKTARNILIAAEKEYLQWIDLTTAADRQKMKRIFSSFGTEKSGPEPGAKPDQEQKSNIRKPDINASPAEPGSGKVQEKERKKPIVKSVTGSEIPTPASAKNPNQPEYRKSISDTNAPDFTEPSLSFFEKEPGFYKAFVYGPLFTCNEPDLEKGFSEPCLPEAPASREKAETDQPSGPNSGLINPVEVKRLPVESVFNSESQESNPLLGTILAVGGLSLATLVAIFLTFSWLQARNWQKQHQPRISSSENKAHTPRMLMIQANGYTTNLGNINRFKSVYIGSAADNAIRIPDKEIAARHLCLFQKRSHLWIKNLSNKEINVNSHKIDPGRKSRITVPATISLTRNRKMHIYIHQEKVKGKEHEKQKQQTRS